MRCDSKKEISDLSFVRQDDEGFIFYPAVGDDGHQIGEQKGKNHAIELIEFYKSNGFRREILSRMIISLVGLDPTSADLTIEQQTMIGHIKGMVSVAHYYMSEGVKSTT